MSNEMQPSAPTNVEQQFAHLNLPSATYASIEAKDGYLTVTETDAGGNSTHSTPYQQQNVIPHVLTLLEQAAQERNLQYIAAAFREDSQFADLRSRLWLQEDIVPYSNEELAAGQQLTPEELVRAVASRFDEENIVQPALSTHNEVQVARLVSREDYQGTVALDDSARLQTLARGFSGKKLVFINATPRGGGVALMRHALIRLLRLYDVDARWYVLQPKKEVFDITKTKFHNVLQAVASPEQSLTHEDKAIYNAWMQENALALNDVFRQADVVVIDDPQPSGLIPYIKAANPDAKIIYRSHIQIVASLTNQPGTPQYTTWSFLWESIQQADYFVSHPMKEFIPDNVPAEKIFYMPATTDPLDGLNKPLTAKQMATYMKLFNALLLQEGQTPLDQSRPYIIQIARFDPSKGIPDALDAYRQLRARLEQEGRVIPQLVITGNGSIDDPDGKPIYTMVWNILRSEPYIHFAHDIKVMRLPHRDQILNMLLRQSKVALQLSIKEGFEVKVTEALMKGRPIIAYRAGGIPLQIEDGITGHLVAVGDTTRVAQYLYTLLTDQTAYQRMSQAAVERANKDYLTIPNALCWLFLAQQLLSGKPLEGHYQWVKTLAESSIPLIADEPGDEQTLPLAG